MNLLFWKREESPVLMLINTLRDRIDELKQLDDTKKEDIAEHVRRLWLIDANTAYEISKRNPKESKKLTRQVEQDEAEMERFLVDLGVGRYSTENQQIIDKAKIELAMLTEEAKTLIQEIDETNHIAEEEMSSIERSVDESIKKIERQMFKIDPIIASKQKLKEWLRFRK